jgi:hypothetical protein
MRLEIGDTEVVLSLTVSKNGGVAGLSPTVSVRRVSDGFYLDFGTSTFQAGFVDEPMVEVDATNIPGVYEVVWDSSQEVTAPGEYVATYVNTGSAQLTQSENISFILNHTAEVETIRKITKNRKKYDSVASTITIYDDDGTTVLFTYNTKGDGGGPSGLNPIFEVIPI